MCPPLGLKPRRPLPAPGHSDRVGGVLVSVTASGPRHRSLLLELKRQASQQMPPHPTPALPSLPLPLTSHLLMLKDSVILLCSCPARLPGPLRREPGAPVLQDLALPASPSSLQACLSPRPLSMLLLTWRALPLPSSLLAELLHIPQGPACKIPSVCDLP